MVCKNCGAKIKDNTEKCPLCDYRFSEVTKKHKKRKRGAGIYKNPFTPIYIFTVLAVVVALLFVSLFLIKDHSPWIVFLFSALFVYFLICHTLLGMRNYISKLSYFSYALCIYMIIIFETTGYRAGFSHIYIFSQSLLFVISIILLISRFKVFKPYISSFIIQALFSYVPLIVTAVTKKSIVASLVVAIIETVFSTAIIIIFPREIVNQIKRFFVA